MCISFIRYEKFIYTIFIWKNSHWRRLCIRLFIVRHDVSTSWCVNMLVLPWTLFYFTMHLSLFFSLVCLFSFSFNYVSASRKNSVFIITAMKLLRITNNLFEELWSYEPCRDLILLYWFFRNILFPIAKLKIDK